MATKVTFSDQVPEDAKNVHFAFGNEAFDVEAGQTVTLKEDTDPAVVASIAAHPWLQLEVTQDEEPPSEATQQPVEPQVVAETPQPAPFNVETNA